MKPERRRPRRSPRIWTERERDAYRAKLAEAGPIQTPKEKPREEFSSLVDPWAAGRGR